MGAQAKILDLNQEIAEKGNHPKNVFEEIFELQLEQLRHDEKYHKEICSLSVKNRINHMVLHFAKYSGRIGRRSNRRADGGDVEKIYRLPGQRGFFIIVPGTVPLRPEPPRLY